MEEWDRNQKIDEELRKRNKIVCQMNDWRLDYKSAIKLQLLYDCKGKDLPLAAP